VEVTKLPAQRAGWCAVRSKYAWCGVQAVPMLVRCHCFVYRGCDFDLNNKPVMWQFYT